MTNDPEKESGPADEADAERLEHDLAVANDVHAVPAEPPGREPGATAGDEPEGPDRG
ncbi:MAG: hypothetical protein ABW212_16945 [Pseudonocardia sediminis]